MRAQTVATTSNKKLLIDKIHRLCSLISNQELGKSREFKSSTSSGAIAFSSVLCAICDENKKKNKWRENEKRDKQKTSKKKKIKKNENCTTILLASAMIWLRQWYYFLSGIRKRFILFSVYSWARLTRRVYEKIWLDRSWLKPTDVPVLYIGNKMTLQYTRSLSFRLCLSFVRRFSLVIQI